MFNLTDYLLGKGITSDVVSRIVSRLSVTINSIDDFNNYTPRQVGLPRPMTEILQSVGIVFKDN